MAEPFLAEIRLFSFSFPPQGWSACEGQTLQIAQNTALYSLLGTAFGSDTKTTFKLPDLRGRVPIHPSNTNIKSGTAGGAETVGVSVNQMPAHTHHVLADHTTANRITPAPPNGSTWAVSPENPFSTVPSNVVLHSSAIANTGGGQPHNNMQPYLAMNFCIALTGYYPPRK